MTEVGPLHAVACRAAAGGVRSESPGISDSQNATPSDSVADLRCSMQSKESPNGAAMHSQPRRSVATSYVPCCPSHHSLEEVTLTGGPGSCAHRCDMCGERGIRRGRLMRCAECDYDLCVRCGVFQRHVGQWASDVSCADPEELAEPEPLPPRSSATETSRQPAVWVPDAECDSCQCCGKSFGLMRWRHHCRACGHCVCYSCSKWKVAVPDMGHDDPVRVCSECRDLHIDGGLSACDEAGAERDLDTPPKTPTALTRLALLHWTARQRDAELGAPGR